MKIALDIESTIADVVSAFQEEYEERHGETPMENTTWEFENVGYDASTFFELTQSRWKHHHLDIPPTEEDVTISTRKIYEQADTVDLVTGRQGAEDHMKEWAEFYDIWYDDFKSVDSQEEKLEMDYDVLIDDSPKHIEALDEDQYLFFYTMPYNKDVLLPQNATRVDNLHQVEISLNQIRVRDDSFKSTEHR